MPRQIKYRNYKPALFAGLFLIQLFVAKKNIAQQYKTESIVDNTHYATSYYDVIKTKKNRILVAGKNGVFAEIEKDTVQLLQKLEETIYKIVEINDSIIVLCANKGTIYYYNYNNKTTKTQKIPALHYASIYSACTYSDSVLYICGGHSKIALAHKTLPRGYIYQTKNAGLTWHKIYYSTLNMVWDIRTNADTIEAICYSLGASTWIKKQREEYSFYPEEKISKNIIHQFINNQEPSFVGGAYTKKKHGEIKIGNSKILYPSFAWSACRERNTIISAHSNGELYCTKMDTNTCTPIASNTSNNLYEIVQVNSSSYYIVGSNNTVLKMNTILTEN